MLIRRLRERCGNPNLIHVGTTSTMITGGNLADQQQAVASVAGKVFGVAIKPESVITETLKLLISLPGPYNRPQLAATVEGCGRTGAVSWRRLGWPWTGRAAELARSDEVKFFAWIFFGSLL